MSENFKYVTINSFDRPNGTDTNFYVTLNGTFTEQFSQIALVDFICTNSFYNVDSTNNTLIFQENSGGVVTATITPGNYALSTMITALQTAMNAVSVNGYTYTITADPITNFITITASAGTFSIKNTGTLNLMLGFSRSTSTSQNNANTGTRIYNLSRYGFLHLICSCSRGDTFNTTTGNRQGILAYIPICESQFGDVYSFRPQPFTWRDIAYPQVDQIQLQLTDDQGNVVDLNGGYMSVSLVLR